MAKVKRMFSHRRFQFFCLLLLAISVAVAVALTIHEYRVSGLWDRDLLRQAFNNLITLLWLAIIVWCGNEILRLKKLVADALAENGRLRAQAG
jgi:hypothetical protein